MLSALQYAVDKGVVVAVASGNNGPNGPNMYPAAYAGAGTPNGVLAVGATSSTDAIASFSAQHDWVRVSAPGVAIVSTLPAATYVPVSGTSMAAPQVAGLAALLLAKCGGISPVEVQAVIETTALDLGSPGRDNAYGAGRIRPDVALAAPCP
jgi:subtilisin family serine protease